ncbi:MAG: C39 family peptidase, partial [Nocardioides sp.]
PWTESRFGLTELVASWEATTPGDSWVEIEVRGRTAAGTTSSYDVLGRWTSGDRFTRRQTVSGQEDDLGKVSVDTWRSTAEAGLGSWQLRVSLMRRPGKATPTLDSVGAVASRLPSGDVTASAPGVARGTVLDVPRYSQMIHQGHYPKWGGGGEAWCSPTSTSMVLAYYDALPEPTAYSYVPAGHVNPWVDHAARMTFDSSYDGTGNWPFNTAYAAPLAGSAFVTRLRSLKEAEQFIAAGIPLVASIAFGRGELTGAPISSSNGHLLVIVGFTESGDVVVNDPAAANRSGVRRTYDRGQLENAWLPTTGGTVYVITDAAHPVPDTAHTNW